MMTARLRLCLVCISLCSAVYGQTPAEAPADSLAALKKFAGYFPKIASSLPDDVCDWCSCISVGCEDSQVTSLSIGRRVGESVNSTYYCMPYTDCPADAFNVTLPPSAFSDLNLPAIDMLEIFDINGPGVADIKGALPDSLPEAMPNLGALQFWNTGLGGTIPQSWFAPGAWPKMRYLQLLNNSGVTGTLPTLAPGSLPSLGYLDFSGANLSGSLPQIVGSGTIESMVLSHLGLSGPLPPDFAAGAGVSNLDLSGNKLNGSLPATWASPNHFGAIMRDLELQDNSLTGNVPDAWGSLVRAAYSMRLALYNNKLTGSIPSSFTDNDQPSYGGADSSADVLFLLPGNTLCGSTPNGTVFKKDSAVFVDSPTVTLPAC